MSKSNFLLVDLNEPKTKKLAETITSETSRKLLNHLAEKEDTEANIAQVLGIPISTVHYHLQKLQEAGLVKVEEFHYSPKGREVNHYQLANKYIIITPQKVSGLREKLCC
ncbi:helix-turn-helix transcriptional regulator [Candidatus Woesearchaeota archaeon]|nr:helix-turn-helix transcriptional regulator [Candidatus Woesearchaeota archaeon]